MTSLVNVDSDEEGQHEEERAKSPRQEMVVDQMQPLNTRQPRIEKSWDFLVDCYELLQMDINAEFQDDDDDEESRVDN